MADFTVGKPVVATATDTIETVDAFELAGGVEYDGSELISNGDFNGNADDWTLQDSGSYADGKVVVLYEESDDPVITHPIALVSGNVYLLSFEISDATDDVLVYFDNQSAASPAFTGDGIKTFLFTADNTSTDTIFFDSVNYDPDTGWTIDNVSCKEVAEIKQGLEIKDAFDRLILALGGENKGNYALGIDALLANIGEGNIGIGDGAGKNITTGKFNVALGRNAEVDSPIGDYQIAIGPKFRMDASGNVKFNGTTPTNYILSNPTTLAELRTLMLALGLAQ